MKFTLKDNDIEQLGNSELLTVVENFKKIKEHLNREPVLLVFDTDLDNVIGWQFFDGDLPMYKIFLSRDFMYKYETLDNFDKIYFLLVLETLNRKLHSPKYFTDGNTKSDFRSTGISSADNNLHSNLNSS